MGEVNLRNQDIYNQVREGHLTLDILIGLIGWLVSSL